jgi:hypothetical protein
MRNFNLLVVGFIVGDALASMMAFASNLGALTTPNLMLMETRFPNL